MKASFAFSYSGLPPRIRCRYPSPNRDATIPMKTYSYPAITLALASTLIFTPGAFGHGGGHSGGGGGGHCSGAGGGHFAGGGWHGGGGCGWHGGGRWHGCYGGYYGGFWGGAIGYPYPYIDWGYGYRDYSDPALYYPQTTYSAVSYSAQNSGSLVKEVQQSLAQTRYYHGAVDGCIGPRTRSAIAQYQKDHDLPDSGRIDKSLLQSLGLL